MQVRCARILLFLHRFGCLEHPAAFTTQSPRYQRGLFLVRPTYTTPAPTEPLAETSVVAEVAKLDCLERTALAPLARPFEGHGSTTTFLEIKNDMLGQEFSAEAVTVALGRLVKKQAIETVSGEDDRGLTTSRYGITTAGMEWLISHTDLALRRAILPEIV